MEEENIERLKAKRRGHRAVTTKLIHETEEIFETPDVSTLNHSRLKIINNLLAEKEKLLQEMDDQVLSLCKVEEIENEIEDSDVIRSKILKVKGRIECLDISKLSASVNTSPTTNEDLPHQQEVIAEQNMLSQDEEQQGQTEGLLRGWCTTRGWIALSKCYYDTKATQIGFKENLMVTSRNLEHFGIDLIARLIKTLTSHL